jgi:large subunit ribosomal protein L29
MTKSYNQLKNLGEKELNERYKELRKELMKLESQVATRTLPEKPGRLRQIKRSIAKILTLLNNKEVREKA